MVAASGGGRLQLGLRAQAPGQASVAQMDEVTQQNAALVEQASAAAQSLAEQAETLRQAVAVFQVE